MLTFKELKERLLATNDEISILEILEINIEEILDRFEDKIETKFEDLCKEFEDETEESYGEDDA